LIVEKESGVVGLTSAKGLSFDEMANLAVDEGWITKPEDFSEALRNDIFAQKEGKPRAERLADIGAKIEEEELKKESARVEKEEQEYLAAQAEIRRLDEKRSEEIEKSTRSEVEEENPDLEGLKENEGFEEFIEGWDEKENLDEETLAELEAWRAGKEEELEVPEAKPEVPETKPEVPETKPEVPEAKPEVPEAKPEVSPTGSTSYEDMHAWINEKAEEYGGKNKFYASPEYAKIYPIFTKITAKHEAVRKAEGEKAMAEAGLIPGNRVEIVGVSLTGHEAPVQGNLYLDKKGIPKVKTDEGKHEKWNKGWKKVEPTPSEASEAEDPVSSLLSSKKKAGVKYEMKMMVAETGETVTVTKDAGVALRETKEELDKMNKFLECLI